jgi:hypothetical protein
MESYLIEVPHEATEAACVNAVRIFLETGSHFLVNADWGCEDGEYRAWMLVDVESREQALHIIPPRLRADAKVTRLRKFTREDINEYLETGYIEP